MLITDALYALEYFGAKSILIVPHEYSNNEIQVHSREEFEHSNMLALSSMEQKTFLSLENTMKLKPLVMTNLKNTQSYGEKALRDTMRVIARQVKDKKPRTLLYYYMLSYFLELRVMKFYPVLAKLPVQGEHSIAAISKRIIAEEKNHLSMITYGLEKLSSEVNFDYKAHLHLEEDLAQNWIRNLDQLYMAGIDENSTPHTGAGLPICS